MIERISADEVEVVDPTTEDRRAGRAHVEVVHLVRGRATGPGRERLAAEALTAAILDDMSRALEEEHLDPE